VAGPTATRGHGAPRSATAKWGKKWGRGAPERVSGVAAGREALVGHLVRTCFVGGERDTDVIAPSVSQTVHRKGAP